MDENLAESAQYQMVGRLLVEILEESPGSTRARCWITSSGGNPRESATENIPPRKW